MPPCFEATHETITPRLLAMLCDPGGLRAVVLHGRRGARRCSCRSRSRSGLAMLASYLLSNTLVPVLSVWLLREQPTRQTKTPSFDRLQRQIRAGHDAERLAAALAVLACYLLIAVRASS